MEEFKNNSVRAKREDEDKKEKIADVEIKENTNLKKKIFNNFLNEDRNSIGEFIFLDVLVPMIKEGIMTAVTGTLSMIFYGDTNARTNISGGYDYNKRYRTATTKREEHSAPRNRLETDSIIFKSRSEAIKVLNYLRDRIDEYDRATIADFYDSVGITTTFTDDNYGWYHLDSAYTSPVSGGYILVLPKAKFLNR